MLVEILNLDKFKIKLVLSAKIVQVFNDHIKKKMLNLQIQKKEIFKFQNKKKPLRQAYYLQRFSELNEDEDGEILGMDKYRFFFVKNNKKGITTKQKHKKLDQIYEDSLLLAISSNCKMKSTFGVRIYNFEAR
jgi:hypothetical protein